MLGGIKFPCGTSLTTRVRARRRDRSGGPGAGLAAATPRWSCRLGLTATSQASSAARDLPGTGGEVKHEIHDPNDQRRLDQGPEPVDVKTAHDVFRDHEHQQRYEEPGNPKREDRQW